jgi:hypothetical protein
MFIAGSRLKSGFGRDVESATLIAGKRPTLINFNAIAIASLG